MIKFILGILFAGVGLPIIESAVELIQLAIEKRKGDYSIDIAKKNKIVHKIVQEDDEEKESTTAHAIGFRVIEQNEEESEEYEDI